MLSIFHRIGSCVVRTKVVAALLACASSAAQQSAPMCMHTITPASYDFPYTRNLVGDFDNDANPDVVYMRMFTLDVMFAPALYSSEMESVATVNDYDVMVTAGGDAILTVSSLGLVERTMDPQTLPTWPWVQNLRAGGDWTNVSKVRVWSVTPSVHYVLGLTADGSSILTYTRVVGANGSVTWSAGPTVTLPAGAAIVGFEPFDRDGTSAAPYSPDGGPAPEIAVMRANQLTIYSPWSAAPSATVVNYNGTSTWTGALLTRIRQSGFTREWLGQISNHSDGTTQRFTTVGSEGIRNVQLFAGVGVCGLVASDLDVDGKQDLVASHTSAWSMFVIPNAGDAVVGPVFASSGYEIASPVTTSASSNRGLPLAADFDCDGDIDTGLPIMGSWMLWIDRGQHFEHALLQPSLSVTSHNGEWAGPLVTTGPFAISVGVLAPPAPSGGWSANQRLQVAMWSQPSPPLTLPPPEELLPMEPRAFYFVRHTLQATPEIYENVINVPGGVSTVSPTTGFDRIVFLAAQVVELNAQGAVVSAGPGIMYCFHGQCAPVQIGTSTSGCSSNEAFVQSLLEMQEQPLALVFATTSLIPTGMTGYASGLGMKVGLGGHVPCMPVPNNNSPHQ